VTELPPDETLLAPLRAVARLRRRRALVAVALATAIAFFATLLVAAVLDWQGNPLSRPILVALLAAAIVAGAGLIWLRRPLASVGDLAFDVDRRAGLEQRFGTAVEVRGSEPDAMTSVGMSLRRAGLRDAGGLEPKALVPLATRPMIAAAVALALILIALPLVPGRPVTPAAIDPSPAQGAGLVATAEEVARLIAADAEARDDSYLAAVAEALRERLALPDAAASLEEDLAELLEHAARAYGSDVPDWLGADSDRMAGLENRIDRFQEEEERRAAAEAARPLGDPYGEMQADDYGLTPEGMRAEPSPNADFAPPANGAEPPEEGANLLASGESEDDGLRRMRPEDLQLAGSMPSGAAMQSGRGQSNAAGLGAETLEPDAAFAGIEATPGEDVVLTATPETGGRRIRIELVPETAPLADGGAAGAVSGSAARAAAEALQRQFVPADRRDVIARYFARAPQ